MHPDGLLRVRREPSQETSTGLTRGWLLEVLLFSLLLGVLFAGGCRGQPKAPPLVWRPAGLYFLTKGRAEVPCFQRLIDVHEPRRYIDLPCNKGELHDVELHPISGRPYVVDRYARPETADYLDISPDGTVQRTPFSRPPCGDEQGSRFFAFRPDTGAPLFRCGRRLLDEAGSTAYEDRGVSGAHLVTPDGGIVALAPGRWFVVAQDGSHAVLPAFRMRKSSSSHALSDGVLHLHVGKDGVIRAERAGYDGVLEPVAYPNFDPANGTRGADYAVDNEGSIYAYASNGAAVEIYRIAPASSAAEPLTTLPCGGSPCQGKFVIAR